MFGAKKKTIGGVEYMVIGSTIDGVGANISRKKYTTTKGDVVVRGGKVYHPDGSVTAE